MKDNFRHQGLRRRMVDELRKKGIVDADVLNAMNKVPRHLFLPHNSIFDDTLYENKAFQIGEGQTISHPLTVAYQSELLELKGGEKVLEVGTGSGYQAAVLAELGARVYSIERHKSLHQKSKQVLQELGYTTIKTFFGDGFKGLPHFAPFQKIIVTCAAPEIPETLKEQLAIGGFMVIPVNNESDNQDMLRIVKKSEDEYVLEKYEEFSFVPMLKGKNF